MANFKMAISASLNKLSILTLVDAKVWGLLATDMLSMVVTALYRTQSIVSLAQMLSTNDSDCIQLPAPQLMTFAWVRKLGACITIHTA